MVAALKIGRVQVLAAGDIWTAKAWNASGDKVTLEGVVHAPGVTNAKTLRAQLNGYVGNHDEEAVPVTWAADPSVDGYYRVTGASVSMRGPSLAHGVFDVSVDLERVLAYSGPVFESVLIGATLTNGLSQAGNAWHGIPNAVDGYSQQALVTATTTRVGEDGTTRVLFFSQYALNPRYLLAPASYYIGAATLRVDDAASALQVVTGTQAENKPTAWEISNGFCRVRPAASGTLSVAVWDGTQWEATTWAISHATGTLDAFDSMTVLRNSPEEVVLRLHCSTSVGSAEGRITVDVSLRRGAAMIRLYIQSEVSRAWKVARGTAEAATSITGGIRASANDAAGNRYVLLSATATTKDTTNGALSIAAGATAVGFGVGASLAGSSAAAPNVITGARGLVEQYFAAQSEQQIVAGL